MKIQSANLLRQPEVKEAPQTFERSSGLGQRRIFRRKRGHGPLWFFYLTLLGAMLIGYLQY
ncbi:MAG: hypothetical protein RRB13_14175 [bacterium]|nr:hypothetical protein [bacterium]